MTSKQVSEKQFRRVSIAQPNKRHFQSGTRLPELKFKRQNIKTEKSEEKSSALANPFSISSVLGKKLMTEQSPATNGGKIKGVELYMKKAQ